MLSDWTELVDNSPFLSGHHTATYWCQIVRARSCNASATSAAQVCAALWGRYLCGLWQVVVVDIIDNLSPSQEALNVLGNSQGRPRGRWKSHSRQSLFHPEQTPLTESEKGQTINWRTQEETTTLTGDEWLNGGVAGIKSIHPSIHTLTS